jgi:hypothetical protein
MYDERYRGETQVCILDLPLMDHCEGLFFQTLANHGS